MSDAILSKERIEVERRNAEDLRAGAWRDAIRALCNSHEALRTERDKAQSALGVVKSAARTIVAGADRRVIAATEHEPAARAAIATLDSERGMNAILTDEVEALRAERDEWRARFSLQTSSGWLSPSEAADLRDRTLDAMQKRRVPRKGGGQ